MSSSGEGKDTDHAAPEALYRMKGSGKARSRVRAGRRRTGLRAARSLTLCRSAPLLTWRAVLAREGSDSLLPTPFALLMLSPPISSSSSSRSSTSSSLSTWTFFPFFALPLPVPVDFLTGSSALVGGGADLPAILALMLISAAMDDLRRPGMMTCSVGGM